MRVQDLDVYKELLSKPYNLGKLCDKREKRFEELQTSTGYLGPKISDYPTNPSNIKQSPVETLVTKRFDARRVLIDTCNEYDNVLKQIYDLLELLSDKEAVIYIEDRHIYGKAWKDIISDSEHSESTIYDHYKKAMVELDRLWKDKKSRSA